MSFEASPRLRAVTLLLAAAAHGIFLSRHASLSVGGSDSSGYANAARRLLAGTLVSRPRGLDRLGLPDGLAPLFIPLGFVPGPRPGTMAPFYPVGFPAHFAAAGLLGGWERGPYWIGPIAAPGCLLLLYSVGRELELSPFWSVATAVILAALPIFVFQAIQPMSDVVSTFWCLAAILAALRSRRAAGWATLAGAAFGVAVLVRPADVLLAIPLLFAMSIRVGTLARAVLGVLPMAGFAAAYDAQCYGGLFRTGYEHAGVLTALALPNFLPRFLYYGKWLSRMLSPLLPLAALAVAGVSSVSGRRRAVVLSWFGVFFVFYCFYGPYESFAFLRFLLPGIPGLLLAAALAAQAATGRLKKPGLGHAAAAVALVLLVRHEARICQSLGVLGTAEGESIYPRISRWVSRDLPDNSVVVSAFASGALEYYTDVCYARWDAMTPESCGALRAAVDGKGYRLFALLFPEEEKQIEAHMPGPWRRLGALRQVGLWRLDRDGAITGR
ncbi:MAG: ArnT family glycosyltransferase [Acidobacteriota bacterium]